MHPARKKGFQLARRGTLLVLTMEAGSVAEFWGEAEALDSNCQLEAYETVKCSGPDQQPLSVALQDFLDIVACEKRRLLLIAQEQGENWCKHLEDSFLRLSTAQPPPLLSVLDEFQVLEGAFKLPKSARSHANSMLMGSQTCRL